MGVVEKSFHPSDLIALASGYWASQGFLTALKLGVFEGLKDRPKTPGQLARTLRLDQRGVDLLLHALATLGLVEKVGAGFQLPSGLKPLLVSEGPQTLVPYLRIHHDRFAAWALLPRVVKRGKPAPAPDLFVQSTPRTRRFIAAMEAMAAHTAKTLAEMLDLSRCSHLLDVGGGSGAYSIVLCRAYPSLHATVLDLPGTLVFTRRYVRAARMEDRIRLLPRDYHRVRFPNNYDAILLSHILHSNGPEACQRLLHRLVKTLRPGGTLIIRDYFLEDSRSHPSWPALFSLNMLLWTKEGRSYSWGEVEGWLKREGLRDFKREQIPFLEGEGVLVARKVARRSQFEARCR
ncbi:MAG: methyltransferase domain-containing protein [candidate division NC10 bacterium]|nr:methyltransferase domain-containing protein [candidate division NC10 bacterium]